MELKRAVEILRNQQNGIEHFGDQKMEAVMTVLLRVYENVEIIAREVARLGLENEKEA